ncbi:uncharacterized protein BP5553_06982 [Venustampulla echinocandica]|uniref:Protein kinase domain-containing protein n=1 Tax=Venustampulla echinocandica TaxID=2656787 RepID=A0A370TI65_9HELO|nr:uncharacterized protein BP5553_06982 [Venustampulla echinocandica]RDL35051.1 hypothetical protein BP5553_06982 [Venustampulla echinocandica]
MVSLAGDCQAPGHAGDISTEEAEAGILPSHGNNFLQRPQYTFPRSLITISKGISLDIQGNTEDGRPPIIHHLSAPAYQSPLRHHCRQPSHHREIKETLDARSEYTNNEEDGRAEHRINQYIIKDEIGRGSFGAVHLAVDQYGKEYAVKEFSKSRLRKRAQSNILRRPQGVRRPGHLSAGLSFNSPLHRHSASDIHNGEVKGNPLYLIKEEIAIMKKLDHPNLVALIEVLDDPVEDSLYMVLEMCKKGVVMKVGLGERADPYDIENCRCWFRDLILGIEYLHAQGVVHRDIKPDNLLLTEDDILKVVDFGVSEMFEKHSEMLTAKSAGSPAFLAPELCVTKHGDVSGKAADIWSMGVCLYCLRFGRIPFESTQVLELYESIKTDDFEIEPGNDPEFCDLLRKLLEKDPKKRITMVELREHPWVTKNGIDPLLSAEENTANLVQPPSETEVNHAITGKMRNLLTMMQAVKKFKSLLGRSRRPQGLSDALGQGARIFPASEPVFHRTSSFDLHDRRAVETALASEGVHHDVVSSDANTPKSMGSRIDTSVVVMNEPQAGSYDGHGKGLTPRRIPSDEIPGPSGPDPQRGDSSGEKGHAHDPLDGEPLFLGVGAGVNNSLATSEENFVAESPTAADFNIYDTAYQKEVERIRAAQGHAVKLYLTRRVDGQLQYKDDKNLIGQPTSPQASGTHEGFGGAFKRAREKGEASFGGDEMVITSSTFADIASKAIENSKIAGKTPNDKGELALDNLMQRVMGKPK